MASVLGLIGDVHAEDGHLALALKTLADLRVDQVLCTGDVVDGRGDANRCCELLTAADTLTVRGNHDRWRVADRLRDLPGATDRATLTPAALRFLGDLPATARVSTRAGVLLLCHGVGDDDMTRLTPDCDGYALDNNAALQTLIDQSELRLVVGGHTHQRMVKRLGALTFINVGSLVPYRDCGFATLACGELGSAELRFYSGLERGKVHLDDAMQL